MLSITLRQIEYALAVARTGGVTTAAQALNVSQPALSVALAQLEAHVGQPLFLRRPGAALAPTGFGRAFLDEAERLVAGIARLTQGQAPQPPVRLGCFEDLAPMLLAPLLARAASCAADIAVEANAAGFEALAEDLTRGRLDLAISYDLGFDGRFTRHEIARVAPHAVLAADHPLAKRPTISLAELAEQPLVLANQGLSVNHMLTLFARVGLSPRVAHRTARLETLRSFAANGLGVGLSYTRPVPDQSYDGLPVVTRLVHDAGPGEPVVVVTLKDGPLSLAAARFADLIRNADLRL